jgi:prepilin-type N-terminal cleavage/methylation domain-containing protein
MPEPIRRPEFSGMESRGVTLLELVVCLLVLGMVAQASLGPLRRQSDALAVRAVREELVALLYRARAEARTVGEASVHLEEGVDPRFVPASGGAPVLIPLSDRGVELQIAGVRSSVALRFGPLGVAQFSPATLVLRRRESETLLVISSYGRVRRGDR